MKNQLNIKISLLSSCFLLLGLAGLQAQYSFNAAGSSATGSGGRVSFSLGQVAFTSQTGSGGSINEGIQQPLEIFVTTAVDERLVDFTATAFPNPTVRQVYLDIPEAMGKDLSFSMTDIHGRLLKAEEIRNPLTQVQMESLSPGTYFITLARQGQPVKTFKIIKNK